jgi:hypothetical protein
MERSLCDACKFGAVRFMMLKKPNAGSAKEVLALTR